MGRLKTQNKEGNSPKVEEFLFGFHVSLSCRFFGAQQTLENVSSWYHLGIFTVTITMMRMRSTQLQCCLQLLAVCRKENNFNFFFSVGILQYLLCANLYRRSAYITSTNININNFECWRVMSKVFAKMENKHLIQYCLKRRKAREENAKKGKS